MGASAARHHADRSVGIASVHLPLQTRPGRLDPRLLDARRVLSSQILFSPVRRPWDSRRSTPDLLTLSTYGIAALVAGGIAAKLGFFKGLWVALFAAKKFIIIGIIALVVAIKKFFGKGKNVTES